MTRRAPSGAVPMAGFTLIETLIALSLLSLLMLVLTSALRAMGETEDRIEQRIDRADRVRIASNFLRDVLGHASARAVARPQAAPGPLFEATPEAMAWVGVMPARQGLGGRHFMRLALESDQNASALVLRHLAWANQSGFPDWSQADAQVIVTDVGALSLRYLDDRSDQWVSEWPLPGAHSRDVLPGAVELRLRTGQGEWPPLVVRMAALAPTDPNNSGFVIGGSR